MQKRTLKVALLAALTVILVLSFSGAALADQTWSDMPDTVTAKYGITDNEVASISDGFDGLWKPFQNITRAQFTKMAVAAFGVPLVDAATPSFTDVPKSNYYYQWIEGAKAAGMVNGSGTAFNPNANITRQQAISIVARYIAQANGYDLASMYTAAEIDALLARYGDGASVASDHKAAMAFAIDMGITDGDAYGNLKPTGNLLRIQAAAFLIRARALEPAPVVPAKIEIVTPDKAENLIGQVHQVTFKVTQADGSAAGGVLVDFDTMFVGGGYYVGNISAEAAMTDADGMVTVNLISAEPGTQRVSAAVQGLAAIYYTKYWLALDEVYTLDATAVFGGWGPWFGFHLNNSDLQAADGGRRHHKRHWGPYAEATAQNNVGTPHEWCVRVVVFGPGPRSTSQQDWYNAIFVGEAFDPANLNWYDGVDATDANGLDVDPTPNNSGAFMFGDGWDYLDELALAAGLYAPRGLAGIPVEWSIYDVEDNPLTKNTNEAVTSVGKITEKNGQSTTPADVVVAPTDADGKSCVTIESTEVGMTLTMAVADYEGNPYPQQLFYHQTFTSGSDQHFLDWTDQAAFPATQAKTWIAHTLPSQGGPITPAYSAANIGEELILTITLVDVYGNPIKGREVEWFMQGVGWFETDDQGDLKDDDNAAGNKDFDTTDKDGKATVFVKSYTAGEQIVHAKVRDKGTGGAEGTFQTYTAEVQWFDVNVVTFDDPMTVEEVGWDYDKLDWKGNPTPFPIWNNEAVSRNPVGEEHEFCVLVYGLKLEYAPTTQDPDGQTPIIDGDTPGSAYDGKFDYKDAEYFGGVPLANYSWVMAQGAGPVGYNIVGDVIQGWFGPPGSVPTVTVAGRVIQLTLEGFIVRYDWDMDGVKENFTGTTGIYIPLEGKTVTFSQVKSLKPAFNGDPDPGPWSPTQSSVGEFDPTKAFTDADGKACVTVTSDKKGPQTIEAEVNWPGNPHNGDELLTAYAKKAWQAGSVGGLDGVVIEIWVDGVLAATSDDGWIATVENKAIRFNDATTISTGLVGNDILNWAHVEVHVKDLYGNDLPDYEVVYLLEDIGEWLGGSQGAVDTYIPLTYLTDKFQETDDVNGVLPDSNEPMPSSDPFGYIVGPGGTPSFYFNQFKGTFWPSSLPQSGVQKWANANATGDPWNTAGWYYNDPDDVAEDLSFGWNNGDEVFDGTDGKIDQPPLALDPLGLATDGAKAWTLDGWRHPVDGDLIDTTQVIPNTLSGSNIDIQLSEDPYASWIAAKLAGWSLPPTTDPDHTKSILRIMVYAPAKGVVEGGSYIWSYQVHKVWLKNFPAPKKIVLEQKDPEAASKSASQWWNQAYDTPMVLGAGIGAGPPPVAQGVVDIRGMVLDQWNRPLYVQDWVPQASYPATAALADYKIMASSTVGGYNFQYVWKITADGAPAAPWPGALDYWADIQGWIGSQTAVHSYTATGNHSMFSVMPPTTITFQAWLDTDNDDIIDPGELQSNKVRTTFVSGVAPSTPTAGDLSP